MSITETNYHSSALIHYPHKSSNGWRSHAYTADYYPGDRVTHATVRLAEIIDGRYYFQPEKYTSHKEIEVSGKREARAVAAAHKATPWNF